MIYAVQRPTPLSAAQLWSLPISGRSSDGVQAKQGPPVKNPWALVSLGTRSETNWFVGSSVKFLFNSPWNIHFFSLTGNHQAPLVALRAIYFEQSSWNQNMGKAKEMLMCFLCSFSVFLVSHHSDCSQCKSLPCSEHIFTSTEKLYSQTAGRGWLMIG